MKRSLQEVAELVVFGLIALLVGTGLLWLVGWILSLGGLLLKSLAGLLWLLLRYIVPIAIVAGLVYFLVKAAQGRQPLGAGAAAGSGGGAAAPTGTERAAVPTVDAAVATVGAAVSEASETVVETVTEAASSAADAVDNVADDVAEATSATLEGSDDTADGEGDDSESEHA